MISGGLKGPTFMPRDMAMRSNCHNLKQQYKGNLLASSFTAQNGVDEEHGMSVSSKMYVNDCQCMYEPLELGGV